MIIRTLTLVSILLLSSCLTSTAIVPSPSGTPEEKISALNPAPSRSNFAIVYIMREATTHNRNVVYLIGVDKQPLIAIANNSYTRIEMPPGVYNFKFVAQAEDFNQASSDFDNGQSSLLIRSDTINIVPFIANVSSSFGSMRYGKSSLESFSHEASYQVPLLHTVTTAQILAPAPDTAPPKKQAVPVISKATETTSARFALLQKQASCKLKNKNWVYTGKQCKNGLAHGDGSAEDLTGLKFSGKFINGQRISGEIHQNANMIFAGNLIEDKPDGNAICFYEGEHEECRFYKGKRIDTLYKIRKENAKMQARMAQAKQPKLTAAQYSQQKGVSDYATDALKREGADRAADFIFDSLF